MLRSTLRRLAPIAVALSALSAVAAADAPWPQFRGPGSRGVSDASGLPVSWSATENVAWKVAIPGRSWSSPVVAGDRVFLTSAVSSGANHDPKKGLYFGGNRPEPLPDEHVWIVLGVSVADGNDYWIHEVHRGKPATGIHIKNTYASETICTDGERVYAYFGGIGLVAVTLDGQRAWMREMKPAATRFGWGTAGSPIVHEGRVYVVNDNEDASWIAAFDAKTGDTVWETKRDEKSNWSTPYVWTHDGQSEIVTLGSGAVRSYDLAGELRWSLRGMSSITIATPYSAGGLLYISSGYVGDSSRPLYAIRPGAKGDISLAEGESSNTSIAWSHPQVAPYNPSTIVWGGQLYVLYDRGALAAFDAESGKEIYPKQRIVGASGFTTSPWAYDGHIFCLDEDGTTHVVEAGAEFAVVRKNELGEMCMATPAIAGKRLYIRTLNSLYAIESRATASTVGAAARRAEDAAR